MYILILSTFSDDLFLTFIISYPGTTFSNESVSKWKVAISCDKLR